MKTSSETSTPGLLARLKAGTLWPISAPYQVFAARLVVLVFTAGLWFSPHPAEITAQAWHLFTLFVVVILAVITNALPILATSVLALAAAVLAGVLPPAKAYSGFANSTVLLIVVAFLMARAILKCGLGERIGQWMISKFGKTLLGLVYSIFLADAIIAPAFPSNTARSGVIYPLILSLAEAVAGKPAGDQRPRPGALLMFTGMASLSLSSALWLTAMAANPLGVEAAKSFGVNITFGSWFAAASVPTLVAMLLLPPFLVKVINPGVTHTPQAPLLAKQALANMGPMKRSEKIAAATFVAMVILWALSSLLKLDITAIAFLGLGVLLASGTLSLQDISDQGNILAIYIWFAILLTFSTQLNELGFMAAVGQKMTGWLAGWSWIVVGLVLLVVYIGLHYLFASQTAHLMALFSVFLGVGVALGVPAAPFALMLLFATNYFSTLTPQASSANLLFTGSGYLDERELYRLGVITTIFNLAVFICIGVPWLRIIAR